MYALDDVGSGSHVHLSLWENGKNIFMASGGHSKHGMSKVGEEFMAGVLNHLPSILASKAPLPNSQETEEVVTKVYVGGIPYYSTEDDIRSYFESCGSITEVDCMKFPESGKFRGIAIMNFKRERSMAIQVQAVFF